MDLTQPVVFALQGDEQNHGKDGRPHPRPLQGPLRPPTRHNLHPRDSEELRLDDATLYEVIVELARFRLLFVDAEVVAKAFQIFRTKALRSGERDEKQPGKSRLDEIYSRIVAYPEDAQAAHEEDQRRPEE